MLVCEYEPGVGIDPHVDRIFWGDTIAGVSLNSPCVLTLVHNKTLESIEQLLSPGSLYVLQGPARYYFSYF